MCKDTTLALIYPEFKIKVNILMNIFLNKWKYYICNSQENKNLKT